MSDDQPELDQLDEALSAPSAADSAGLLASVACAVHCAAMPLVIGYLPMLGLSWLADPGFHRVMAMICFALALLAFMPGWRRHGSLTPALFGAAGVGLLTFAAFGLEGECCPSCVGEAAATPQLASTCGDSGCHLCVETAHEAPTAPVAASAATWAPLAWSIPLITPAGGVLLIAGHVSNHRRSCACCRDRDCSSGSGQPTA